MGLTNDLSGGSSLMWRYHHQASWGGRGRTLRRWGKGLHELPHVCTGPARMWVTVFALRSPACHGTKARRTPLHWPCLQAGGALRVWAISSCVRVRVFGRRAKCSTPASSMWLTAFSAVCVWTHHTHTALNHAHSDDVSEPYLAAPTLSTRPAMPRAQGMARHANRVVQPCRCRTISTATTTRWTRTSSAPSRCCALTTACRGIGTTSTSMCTWWVCCSSSRSSSSLVPLLQG